MVIGEVIFTNAPPYYAGKEAILLGTRQAASGEFPRLRRKEDADTHLYTISIIYIDIAISIIYIDIATLAPTVRPPLRTTSTRLASRVGRRDGGAGGAVQSARLGPE